MERTRSGSAGRRIESETQLRLNGIKGGKDAMGEILLTQLVPQMLHRIHLRTVGGLKEQADVFGNLQIRRTMPARLIDLHDDEGICKRKRDVLKKQVHHGRIGVRKQERHHFAQLRGQSRESIHGLTNGVLRSVRAHPRRSPASLWFTHAWRPWPHPGPSKREGGGHLALAREGSARPASDSFFKMLLSLWIGLGVTGSRHELAPTMPIQEAIDGRLMNRFANMELKCLMNLLDGGQFSRLSPLEKRSEKGLFF